jgi:hypothetical protein
MATPVSPSPSCHHNPCCSQPGVQVRCSQSPAELRLHRVVEQVAPRRAVRRAAAAHLQVLHAGHGVRRAHHRHLLLHPLDPAVGTLNSGFGFANTSPKRFIRDTWTGKADNSFHGLIMLPHNPCSDCYNTHTRARPSVGPAPAPWPTRVSPPAPRRPRRPQRSPPPPSRRPHRRHRAHAPPPDCAWCVGRSGRGGSEASKESDTGEDSEKSEHLHHCTPGAPPREEAD